MVSKGTNRSLFALEDRIKAREYSKLMAFNSELFHHYPYVKYMNPNRAPLGPEDIVFVNVDSSMNYEKYKNIGSARKIAFVHEFSKDSIPFLKRCYHIIYLNRLQEEVAKMAGIRNAHTTLPHHPFPTNLIITNKQNKCAMCGMHDGDFSTLLKDIETVVNEHGMNEIVCSFCFSGDVSKYDAMVRHAMDIRGNLKEGVYLTGLQQPETFVELKAFLNVYKAFYVKSKTATWGEIEKRISSGDQSVLDETIGESMLCSYMRAYGATVYGAEGHQYTASANGEKFDYKDLADLVSKIVAK